MPGTQLRLLVLLLIVAAVLVVVGMMSGWSINLESEPSAGQAAISVACGSPWVPDYGDAERNIQIAKRIAARGASAAHRVIARPVTFDHVGEPAQRLHDRLAQQCSDPAHQHDQHEDQAAPQDGRQLEHCEQRNAQEHRRHGERDGERERPHCCT